MKKKYYTNTSETGTQAKGRSRKIFTSSGQLGLHSESQVSQIQANDIARPCFKQIDRQKRLKIKTLRFETNNLNKIGAGEG